MEGCHFDADSAACVTTLAKIVDNIVHRKDDARTRQIRCANTAFDLKVTPQQQQQQRQQQQQQQQQSSQENHATDGQDAPSWRVAYLLQSARRGWRRHKSSHTVSIETTENHQVLSVKNADTSRVQVTEVYLRPVGYG